ncbi:MAG: nuclear transport factor 2 family protein [Myxococcales bacterium]|nr:nuclear transport factor 2 family protein [Myxococcales bacterium]
MMALIATILVGGTALANDDARGPVARTLKAWVQATDAQDVPAVRAAFHPDAVQVVQMGDKAMTLTTPAYVSMIEEGKIGGGKTRLQIHEITVRAPHATAHITRSSDAMVMEDALVLQHTEDGWRITGATIRATAR